MDGNENRAVAFLDVLGFKELLEKHTAEDLGERYRKALIQLKLIEHTFNSHTNLNSSIFSTRSETLCNRYVFSDSIILVSLDDTEESTLKLLYFTFRLMQFLIASKFPVRGGISFGPTFEDKENNIVVGKSLVSAANLEARQDWIGTTIDTSITEQFDNLFSDTHEHSFFLQRLFPNYDVPFKSGEISNERVINWRWELYNPQGIESMLPKYSTWDTKRKIDNTLSFCSYLRQKKGHYVFKPKKTELPLEANFFGIGESIEEKARDPAKNSTLGKPPQHKGIY